MTTRLIPTGEFTGCFTRNSGFGPWSDRTNKTKIIRAWRFLDSVFDQGVAGSTLAYKNAIKSPGRRRRYLPNSFGPLYQEFKEIEPIPASETGFSQNKDAYLCIIPFEKFQISFLCAFIGGKSPRFFVIFAGPYARCLDRHTVLRQPGDAGKLFKSLDQL